MKSDNHPKKSISELIAELYPEYSDAEREVVEANLRRYHLAALSVYERQKQEEESVDHPDALTNGDQPIG